MWPGDLGAAARQERLAGRGSGGLSVERESFAVRAVHADLRVPAPDAIEPTHNALTATTCDTAPTGVLERSPSPFGDTQVFGRQHRQRVPGDLEQHRPAHERPGGRRSSIRPSLGINVHTYTAGRDLAQRGQRVHDAAAATPSRWCWTTSPTRWPTISRWCGGTTRSRSEGTWRTGRPRRRTSHVPSGISISTAR